MKKYIFGIAFIGLGLQGFTILSKEDKMITVPKKDTHVTVFQNADKGKGVYAKTCIACHQATGVGVPGAFPPLAKSDYLNADVNRAIKQVIKGSNGTITVNGKKFTGAMPPQALSDQQIADVLTYVYASWGNSKKVVTPVMVKAQRK
jgi:mono/diheme cytochrome c family protein